MGTEQFKFANASKHNEVMFDKLMKESDFFYPKMTTNVDEIFFFIEPKNNYINPDHEIHFFCFFIFNWINELRDKNLPLHNHIMDLIIDDEIVDDDKKRKFILSYVRHDNLYEMMSDSRLLTYIHDGLVRYLHLIYDQHSAIIKAFEKFDGEIDDYIRGGLNINRSFVKIDTYLKDINMKFSPLPQIRNVEEVRYEDLEDLIVREFLTPSR